MKTPDYSKDFSEQSLSDKLCKFAKTAGKEVIEKVLQMYFSLKDPDTPGWAKSIIIAALGYFICPLDAIPDIVPLAGYSDDLGALAMALATVAVHIKAAHREQASAKISDWFETEDTAAMPPANSTKQHEEQF